MNKLIGVRAEHKVSQEKLAEIIGINKNTYYEKEVGNRDFKLKEVRTIAKYFNLNAEQIYLIFFKED